MDSCLGASRPSVDFPKRRTRSARSALASNAATSDPATCAGRSFHSVRFSNTARNETTVHANARAKWKLIATQTLPLGTTTFAGMNRSTGTTPEPPVPNASGSNLVAHYRLEANPAG